MIYFGSFFAGVINGLFASGAGQILVFVLIFILKEDSNNSRATSICAIGLVTIFTIIRYLVNVKVQARNIVLVVIVGAIFGGMGAKAMNKIPGKYLNLASGLIVVLLSLYSLIRG